jgi:glycosyltransferase involved in cell wall biosynthesis
MDCSIVIPVLNEQGSLRLLQDRLDRVLKFLPGHQNEIIYVDDGSTDKSLDILKDLAREYPYLKVIARPQRGGQSVALKEGMDASRGEWVAMLDADLQNPPEELLKLFMERDDFDYVVGCRVGRRDGWSRRVGSSLGYFFRFVFLGDRVKDAGCTIKVFRKKIFDGFPFGRDWHYFMTCWVQWRGFRFKVVPVAHEKRLSGHSNYTWKTLICHGWRGLMDFRKHKNSSKRPRSTAPSRCRVLPECH